MAQDNTDDLPELSSGDAYGAVVWRPLPNRRRSVLMWTLRSLVVGAVIAGAWSLRDRYPRIDLNFTGLVKQIHATHPHVDQPVISKPKEHIVVKEPPKAPTAEWRPPLDTRSVVKTVPSQ
jgi:hypothetical protein